MARPSRNVDVQLLAAGRELYPETGAGGLSVRKVVERAGANLGMFHYHFRTKDAFVRTLLQSVYETMFAELEVAAQLPGPPVAALRSAMRVIARFGRDNRRLLRRLVADAVDGEPAALDFLRANFPRHFGVIVGLIAAGQRAGMLKPVPLAQAVTFIAGAVAAPILVGSAVVDAGLAPAALADRFDSEVLADAALDERIDLALAGLAVPSGASP
ncbi:MAG: TetR/AcrR family transcriptional regulator [Thermoleophilaceae bacterium]